MTATEGHPAGCTCPPCHYRDDEPFTGTLTAAAGPRARQAPEWADPVEREYLLALGRTNDPDKAQELVIGLRQYRELFRDSRPPEERR